MNKKQVAIVIGVLAAAWHIVSIIKDAERYEANWTRWQAAPTTENLIRLLAAEGVLIDEIGWLL